MINEEEWQSQVTSLARHLSSDSQIYPAVAACSPRTSSHLSFPDRSSWKKKDFSYLICNLPSLSRLTCLLTFQHTKKNHFKSCNKACLVQCSDLWRTCFHLSMCFSSKLSAGGASSASCNQKQNLTIIQCIHNRVYMWSNHNTVG